MYFHLVCSLDTGLFSGELRKMIKRLSIIETTMKARERHLKKQTQVAE